MDACTYATPKARAVLARVGTYLTRQPRAKLKEVAAACFISVSSASRYRTEWLARRPPPGR
jgi:hypothetical protein